MFPGHMAIYLNLKYKIHSNKPPVDKARTLHDYQQREQFGQRNSIDTLLRTSTFLGYQAYSTAQIVQPLIGCTKGASNWFKNGKNVSSQMGSNI